MDPLSSVTFEVAAGSAGTASHVQATNVTVFDVTNFEQMFQQTSAVASPAAITPLTTVENQGFAAALESLKALNQRMENLGVEAMQISAESRSMTPAEMIEITVKSHEFVFQSQLTATVANKSSDGVAQLFRQQS